MAWGIAVVVSCLVAVGASPAVAADRPGPDIVYPADPPRQEAYERGLAEGYDEGLRDAQDQADLQGEVQDEAEQVDPTPTPTPSPTDAPLPSTTETVPDADVQESGGGFPWWPLAFAAAATAWFVTRRRRQDLE